MKPRTGQPHSDLSSRQAAENTIVAKSRDAGILFGAAIFLSAFLLFLIQPLISKALLPWFGGTPGVWTTCMLFFQLLLCGGYFYSHLSTSLLASRWQVIFHAGLLAVALCFLRILPSTNWKPSADEAPALCIVLLLSATVGLPYFILSTTGPLLLRWFSLLRSGASPWRFYALSNAGSLLALLSYPIIVEPQMTISAQATAWTSGFWVFAFFCAACGFRLWRNPAGQPSELPETSANSETVKPTDSAKTQRPAVTLRMAVVWFAFSMVASTMLLAETNEVCQDVAVIPFLWVIPLSCYLLSFILCFESDRWYRRSWYSLATAILVLAVCWLQSFGARTFLLLQLAVYFGALFCVCMLCHGELARRRPAPALLTAFYLIVSAGGAGGGLFVALLSPLIFPAFWELYLGLIAASIIALIVYFDHRGWMTGNLRPPVHWTALAIALFVGVGTVFAAAVMNYTQAVAMVRNFYGVLEVETDAVEDAVILRHGRIIHGLQLEGIPGLPTMYYGYKSGVGRAVAELRQQKSSLRIGLVGLGAGTIAAYGQPGDAFRFYEINENVTRLAKQHFTFLERCPATVEILHGDARLLLEGEAPQRYDLLVLDAFSGDAIPAHLLTLESITSCMVHLSHDGLLAIHISNLHFDLRRVTDGLAEAIGLHATTLDTPPVIDPTTGAASLSEPGSRWVLLARDPALLDRPRFEEIRVREPVPPERRVVWTDDFSNLFEVLDW